MHFWVYFQKQMAPKLQLQDGGDLKHRTVCYLHLTRRMVLLGYQCRGKQGSWKPMLQQLMVYTHLCDLALQLGRSTGITQLYLSCLNKNVVTRISAFSNLVFLPGSVSIYQWWQCKRMTGARKSFLKPTSFDVLCELTNCMLTYLSYIWQWKALPYLRIKSITALPFLILLSFFSTRLSVNINLMKATWGCSACVNCFR